MELSRRDFLGASAAIAAAWGLDLHISPAAGRYGSGRRGAAGRVASSPRLQRMLCLAAEHDLLHDGGSIADGNHQPQVPFDDYVGDRCDGHHRGAAGARNRRLRASGRGGHSDRRQRQILLSVAGADGPARRARFRRLGQRCAGRRHVQLVWRLARRPPQSDGRATAVDDIGRQNR